MAENEKKETTGGRSEEIGLHNLRPKPGSRRPRKRVGRGEGSGVGKTSGRGHGGQGQRSGNKQKVNLEGGQDQDFQYKPTVIMCNPNAAVY